MEHFAIAVKADRAKHIASIATHQKMEANNTCVQRVANAHAMKGVSMLNKELEKNARYGIDVSFLHSSQGIA